MHGLEGATQVIAALLHGACTLHTSNTSPSVAHVAGTFETGQPDVRAETAAFLKATEPHPLWEGPTPLCLAEHDNGKVRRLRLVLTKQSCLSQGEQNQLLFQTHPLHGSGLLFGCAADGLPNPDWLVVPDTSHPGAGACYMLQAKQAVHASSRLAAQSAVHQARVTQPTRRGSTSLKHSTKYTFIMHGGMNRSIEKAPPCYCPGHQRCSNKDASGAQ